MSICHQYAMKANFDDRVWLSWMCSSTGTLNILHQSRIRDRVTVEATLGLSWTQAQCPTGWPAIATRAPVCVHGSHSCAVTPCHSRGIVSQLVSEYRVALPLPGCLYNIQTSQPKSRQGVKDNFGAICNHYDYVGLVSNRKHVMC